MDEFIYGNCTRKIWRKMEYSNDEWQYCWVRPPEIKTIVMNDCSWTGYNGIKINFWSKLISDDWYNVVLFNVEENFHQNIEKKFSIEIWCEFILEKKNFDQR